jgi:hypothetical protein
MDVWTGVGVFLAGAATGAVTTVIFYTAQIRTLKNLLETLAHNRHTDSHSKLDSREDRKSA